MQLVSSCTWHICCGLDTYKEIKQAISPASLAEVFYYPGLCFHDFSFCQCFTGLTHRTFQPSSPHPINRSIKKALFVKWTLFLQISFFFLSFYNLETNEILFLHLVDHKEHWLRLSSNQSIWRFFPNSSSQQQLYWISKTHPYLVNTFSTFQYLIILFILVTTLVFYVTLWASIAKFTILKKYSTSNVKYAHAQLWH